eukprot:TRINITY_DN25637_c0_g1_i1.p1 TRINITY_DN25637_c0_g1~~TRINITY_DN25637_c0_g1_i1.p1  ORF type:complete len:271 (-),score=74.97 TRINITY_DN25637_c0_g1_i1:212-1024(-)
MVTEAMSVSPVKSTLSVQSCSSRKERVALTLIPENDQIINYRFNVVLVAENATEFAQMAVLSEMAEAYKPKKAEDAMVGRLSSDGDATPTSAMPTIRNEMILFCPTGSETSSKELARLRFQPVERFSDALPADTSNTVVAFLFWRVSADGADEFEKASATSDRITDYMSRMAEINHLPKAKRPYTTILAFEADEEQQKKLGDFVSKQSRTKVVLKDYSDDCEETGYEAMQDLVEEVIRWEAEGRFADDEPEATTVVAPEKVKSKGFCSVQ